jgi:hypothetical protein
MISSSFSKSVWKDNYIGQGELQMKFIMSDGAAAMHNGAQRWHFAIMPVTF